MTTRANYRSGILTYFDGTTHERVLPVAPIVFYDDFLGADVALPAAGSPESGCRWVGKVVKTAGSPTVVGKADETNGAIECALDATSEKQGVEAYFNDELQFSIAQGLVFEARFKPSTLPTLAAEMVVGLVSAWADGLDATTYNAFVTMDGSGEIFCEKDDNATDESATSGVTLTATDWATVRIDCSDPASILFYVNGAGVATSTTFDWAASAANSKVQPIFGCYKASGAGVGTLLVDYVRVWQKRS